MLVRVELLGPLRSVAGKRFVELDVEGRIRLSELLNRLGEGLRRFVVDDLGKPQPGVLILVNGVDVRYLSWLETEIEDGDTVTLIPSIHGG